MTDVNHLAGQHVLILGLGASGLAMARWCARCGAQVTVADTRQNPPQLAALREQLPQARFIGGAFNTDLLTGVHAVFRSPGLAPAEVAIVSVAAQAGGISAGGELSLFSQALARLKLESGYAPSVLAVTGTNGKTTVTALCGQLVLRSGKTVAVAGNIGPTLLDTLAAHIDSGSLPEVWVLELSSFQLDALDAVDALDNADAFEPTAAAVLNLTQDHLDWHGTMAVYTAAKAKIFGRQALLVLNREDPLVMDMLPEPVKPTGGKLRRQGGSLREKGGSPRQRAHRTFGANLPRRPGDFGIEVVNGMAWLVRAQDAHENAGKHEGRQRQVGRAEQLSEPLPEQPLTLQRLMPADALRIRGRHNAGNALAALALAGAAGCALGPMLHGLREYRGEAHRVQSLGLVGGVEYFDDSKGTNVGATVAALQGLGEPGYEADATGSVRKLVVILGGEGKGQDFSPLAVPVARFARAAVLIGRDAGLIRSALSGTGALLLDAATLEEAVQLAAGAAQDGDAVLMSPACASFDMFRDYGHRAEVFRGAVRALAAETGVELEGAA